MADDLSYSWTKLEPPEDTGGRWRVAEKFRDRPLTLAMLDTLVSEFDQGCMEGRKSFIDFIVKACVGGDEWWEEVKRQEEERTGREAQEARERRARARTYEIDRSTTAVARALERFRVDFDQGYIPPESCGADYCMAEECVTYRAWQVWNDEQDTDDEDDDG